MDVALLLSILGGANTFGRLVAGALGGKTWVDALIVNNVALVLAGGATVALPFCDSHYLLVTFAAVFGLCVGKWCLGSLPSPYQPHLPPLPHRIQICPKALAICTYYVVITYQKNQLLFRSTFYGI